jgi:hypothetical protein
MHLARLGLKNFRSFEDEEILFSKDLSLAVNPVPCSPRCLVTLKFPRTWPPV